MLEKTPLGKIPYENAQSIYVERLLKDIEKLKFRIVELEGQLRWTEMELSRHF